MEIDPNLRHDGKLWRTVAAVFLCWAMSTSMLSLYYAHQYSETLRRLDETTTQVSMIIDYGNGSTYRKYYKDIPSLVGESLLSITIRLTRAKYDIYPMGAMVTSIDGIENTGSKAWLWYRWNEVSGSWLLGETGPDKFLPKNGEIVVWYYTSFATWPPSPPRPPGGERSTESRNWERIGCRST